MGSSPTLGPVAFSDFEVPERISFGGRQRLAVHELPGGTRIIDTLGADEGPIRWSGVFSGASAAQRARTLDLLRKTGATLLLTWDAWRFLVIIRDFEVIVSNANWMPYRLALCVAPSPLDVAVDWLSQAAGPVLSLGNLPTDALRGLLNGSLGSAGGSGLSGVVAAAGNQAQAATALAFTGSFR